MVHELARLASTRHRDTGKSHEQRHWPGPTALCILCPAHSPAEGLSRASFIEPTLGVPWPSTQPLPLDRWRADARRHGLSGELGWCKARPATETHEPEMPAALCPAHCPAAHS